MAIKSKSKSRAKQRSVARGPRHEPVPVPKPFAQRRWVQLTALFVAGALVTLLVLGTWTHWQNLRANDRAAQELTTRQQALSQWKALVEGQVSSVGQLQGSPPPILATDITAAVTALGKGNDPDASASDLTTSAKALGDAAKAIEDFDLAGAITGHGFDLAGSTTLTSSKADLVQGLTLYEEAGKLAVLAMAAEGNEAAQLAGTASTLEDSASALMQSGWVKYVSVLADNQLSPGGSATGLGSGLSGGLGG
jgi:hypothetical protein